MSDYADKFERMVRQHVASVGGLNAPALELEVTYNKVTGYPTRFVVTPYDGFDTILWFTWNVTTDRTKEFERFKQELGVALADRA